MAACVSSIPLMERYRATQVKKEEEDEEEYSMLSDISDYLSNSSDDSSFSDYEEINADDNVVGRRTEVQNDLQHAYSTSSCETELPDTKPVIVGIPVINVEGCAQISKESKCLLSISKDKNKSASLPNPYVKLYRCDNLLKKSTKQSLIKTSDSKGFHRLPGRSRQPSKLIYSQDFVVFGIDDLYNNEIQKTKFNKHTHIEKKSKTRKTRKVKSYNRCCLDAFYCREKTCSHIVNNNLSKTRRLVPQQIVVEGSLPVPMSYIKDGIWTVEPVNLVNGFDKAKEDDLGINVGDLEAPDVQIKSENIDYEYEQQQLLQQEQYFDGNTYADRFTTLKNEIQQFGNEDNKIDVVNDYPNVSQTSSFSGNSTNGNTVADKLTFVKTETQQLDNEDVEIDVVTDYPVPIFSTDLDKVHHDHTYAEHGMSELNKEKGLYEITFEKLNQIQSLKLSKQLLGKKILKAYIISPGLEQPPKQGPILSRSLQSSPMKTQKLVLSHQPGPEHRKKGKKTELENYIERQRRTDLRHKKEFLLDMLNLSHRTPLHWTLKMARKEILMLLLEENRLLTEMAQLRHAQSNLERHHELLRSDNS